MSNSMEGRQVLLLNASYEPIRILGMTRAMVLLLQKKAEMVEAVDGRFIYSAFEQFEMPSVIRLNYMVTIPFKARVALNRRSLMGRDGHLCQWNDCDRRATTIDHVHPRSKGGRHEWTNVVACCTKCNSKKADRLASELGWKLKREPQVPRVGAWMMVGPNPPEKWMPYLGM